MIIISLDEGGIFEEIENGHTNYIGGAIYECKNDSEKNQELKRLKRWFVYACDKASETEGRCEYPEDLHYNWKNGVVVNSHKAKKVKSILKDTLPDFVQGKGIWENDAPKGDYRLYVYLGNENGIDLFTKNGISNLIDDDMAGNRYEHMAYRAIENLLFYNARLKGDEYVLELATRVIDEKEGVEELGLEKNRFSKYKVTQSGSFRAALASAVQNSDRKSIQVELNVKSINYCTADEEEALQQGFLYLADTICSVFDSCKKQRTLGDALCLLKPRVDAITADDDNFYWGYDEVDQYYRDAYTKAVNGEYYSALEKIYIEESSDCIAEHYKTVWFKDIENIIDEQGKYLGYLQALESLDDYLHSSDYSVKKAEYILGVLKASIEKKDLSSNLLYRMYVLEMTIRNHSGEYNLAMKSYDKCLKYAKNVDVEDYLGLRDMVSVAMCDAGKYKEAIEYTKETLSYKKLLKEIKEIMNPYNDSVFIHYGRGLSQLGQCYAFDRDYENAEKCFKEAIDLFGESEVDRNRTRSYYLHELIETKKKDSYQELASVYFDTEIWEKQLVNLQGLDSISFRFGAYVLAKATFIFFMEDIPKNELLVFADELWKYVKTKTAEHPDELICKYIALVYSFLGEKHKYVRVLDYLNNLDFNNSFVNMIKEKAIADCKYYNNHKKIDVDDRYTYMYH